MNDVVEGKIERRGLLPMMVWSCQRCSEPWQSYMAETKVLATTCSRCDTSTLVHLPGATVHDWRSHRSDFLTSLKDMKSRIGNRKLFPWEVQDRAMYERMVAMIDAHIGRGDVKKSRRVQISIEPATFAKVLGLTGDLSYYRTEIEPTGNLSVYLTGSGLPEKFECLPGEQPRTARSLEDLRP